MNEVQTKIISFRKRKKPSINHCLLVLGADKNDVYYVDRITGTCRSYLSNKHKTSRFCNPYNSAQRSIYDRYSVDELKTWSKHLYIESLKKYHPDYHPDNVRLYTEICQEITKAYETAIRILNRKG